MAAQTSLPHENAPRAEVGSVQNLTKGLQDVSLDEIQSEPGEEVLDELYIQYGMRFMRDKNRIRGSPTPAHGLVDCLVSKGLLPTRKKLGDFFEMVFIKTGRADLQKLHCIQCRSVFSSPTELGTHLRYDETHRKGTGYLQSLRGKIVRQAVKQEVIKDNKDREASFKEIDKRFRENFDSDDDVHKKMVDYYAACMVMRTIGEMTEEGAKRKKENVKRKEENRTRQISEAKTKTKKKNAKKKKKQKGTMAPETNEANNNNNMSRAYDDNDGTTPKDSADSQEESKQGHAQRKPRRNKSKKKKGNAAASNAQQLEHDPRYEE